MGWFWDSEPSKDSTGSTSDAYSKLDPALKDFLDKESPLKQDEEPRVPRSRDRPPTSPDGAPTTYRSQIGIDLSGVDQNAQSQANTPTVPTESLFQDGRYAHLWKSYRSQSEIDVASKTDQDKLADVVDAYKDRKAAIGRAALENCVMEQMEEKDCYRHGGFMKTMTMCRAENRAFNRCYTMQSRFLKALGYLSNHHATEEDEERIQMHADRLYHEMLEREKAADEAKKEGKEAPTFQPLIQHDVTTKALGEQGAYAKARQRAQAEGLSTSLSAYAPEKQKEIKERLEGMSEAQREVELQLIAAETRAQLEYTEQIRERMEEERAHRAGRRERGKESVGDTVKRWWGWQ